MAETPQQIVERELREFKRYTGDGLPGEPVNAPLPVGDPQSGVHNPKKVNLRKAMLAPVEAAAQSASDAKDEADRADLAADRAQNAASAVTSRAWFDYVSTLLADDNDVIGYVGSGADFEVGPGDIIEAQGFRYEVAASDAVDWHVETAGGVKLYVLTHYKRLYAAAFGLEADTGVDVTLLAQKVIDALPSGKGITLVIPAGRYKVSKNTALANYPGNDQPCLEFRGKTNFRVEAEGAVFFCETHAQGVFEFQLCEDGEIVGLMAEGAGNFPPLDGTTERGEKGISDAGYSTVADLWGSYKNNSNDTSARTAGGYGGAFPQWGGGTAASWGEWNGGYIGNQGSGLLIHNGCKNLKLTRCGGTLFNGSGIRIGFLGDYNPGNDASTVDIATNSNITLDHCINTENYDAGITYFDVDGLTIINTESSDNGHPLALGTDAIADPGYGTTAQQLPTIWSDRIAKNVLVFKSPSNRNKRRGHDVHSGDTITIMANPVEGNLVSGISSVGGGDGGWPASNITIANNTAKGSALEASIYLSRVEGGEVYGNLVDDLGLGLNNGISTGNNPEGACSDVSVHDNRVKISGSGRPYLLVHSNGSCYNNRWEGGDVDSFLKSNIKSSFAIPDVIAFDVTFNGTATPEISNVTGTDHAPTASSIETGVQFNFPDDIDSIGLDASVVTEIKSSGGLVISGGTVSTFYTRTVEWPIVAIGIKGSWGGGHTSAANITSGVMRVTLSLY